MTKIDQEFEQKLKQLESELKSSKTLNWKRSYLLPLMILATWAVIQFGWKYFNNVDANNGKIPVIIQNQAVLKVQQDSTRKDVRMFSRWIFNHDACAWKQRFLDSIGIAQNKQAHILMIGLLNKMAKRQGIEPIQENAYSYNCKQ
jgi:hypothetical protein